MHSQRFSASIRGLTLLLGCAYGAAVHASPFLHGVASGDPLADRVILWTRISLPSSFPKGDERKLFVSWKMAVDPAMAQVVSEGMAPTSAERDYTVKVDAAGLNAGATYYYQFTYAGETSPVGRTRTLPSPDANLEHASFLTTSCSNYPYGLFNAYSAMADEQDVTAVLHLGDYIYEYEDDVYGNGKNLGREPIPGKEIVTLQDYRQRYAEYRTDPDLQRVHQMHPFITVWDDHETANNSYENGAENHQPNEGDWITRRNAGVRAYHEWLPIRSQDGADDIQIYRSFQIGRLASLVMLDTRLVGRNEQVSADSPLLKSADRQLLGRAQEQWLDQELGLAQSRSQTWQLIGQQVMMSPLILGGKIYNTDQWDGYPAARQRLLQQLVDHKRTNSIVLAGDIHSSWASEISSRLLDSQSPEKTLAVELVVPGVTSPAIEDPTQAAQTAAAARAENPGFKYADLNRRGYIRLDLTPTEADAQWIYVDTIQKKPFQIVPGPKFKIPTGDPRLMEIDRP